jgi:hypothetical protein
MACAVHQATLRSLYRAALVWSKEPMVAAASSDVAENKWRDNQQTRTLCLQQIQNATWTAHVLLLLLVAATAFTI